MESEAHALETLLAQHRLRYVDVTELTVMRLRCGRGFTYRDAAGTPVRTKEDLHRFKRLAIPPAWVDVRLAPEPACHLQALGCDALGRLQRRYHDAWEQIRNADKLARLQRFAVALPRVRSRVERDIRRPLQDPDALCATAVRLIDLAHLRPGSEAALKEIGSRGATTLAPANVNVKGSDIGLAFRGKSRTWVEIEVTDPVLSRKLARLKETNRRRLFRIDHGGRSYELSCAALNAYLQSAAGSLISAKDFRTFDATSTALWRLAGTPLPASVHAQRRVLAEISREVAQRLHNTPAIARNSYIHSCVIDAWMAGEFGNGVGERLRQSVRTSRFCSRPESALRRFLATYSRAVRQGQSQDAQAA